MNIRNLKSSDYELISSWWKDIGQHGPTQGQLPEDSSFILELDNKPILTMSVFLTNTDIAYFENLISDPNFKHNRKFYTQALMDHSFSFAKSKGYKYAVAFTTNEKLVNRNLKIGFDTAVRNLFLLSKEL